MLFDPVEDWVKTCPTPACRIEGDRITILEGVDPMNLRVEVQNVDLVGPSFLYEIVQNLLELAENPVRYRTRTIDRCHEVSHVLPDRAGQVKPCVNEPTIRARPAVVGRHGGVIGLPKHLSPGNTRRCRLLRYATKASRKFTGNGGGQMRLMYGIAPGCFLGSHICDSDLSGPA